jgi:hypothetical protein
VTGHLCELFEKRLPPPVASQKDVLTRQFWTGRRIFLVADDMTSWRTAENPLHAVIQRPAPQVAPGQPVPQIPAPLPPLSTFVEQGEQIGLHHRRRRQAVGLSHERFWDSGHDRESGAADGDPGRPPGVRPIISGVLAEPQRPGKGLYVTPSSTDVLVAWSPPPVFGPPGGEKP